MNYRVVAVTEGQPLWNKIEEFFNRAVRRQKDPNDDGDYRFFAAVDEKDEFLGGTVIDLGTIHFGPLAKERGGFLEDIEVLEPYRRKGIGTALLRAALNEAWTLGAQHVRWTVGYENEEGLGFYHSLGLALCPEEDPDSPDPELQYLVVATNPHKYKFG